MSEPTPEVTATEPATPATDATSEVTPAVLGDAGKKAIDAMKAERDAARREARANADAAKRLAEFEESQKSEAQKIADRAAAAERERDEARAEGLAYKAAAKNGVSEDYFDLLGSGDEDTINSRAERLGSLLRAQTEIDQLRAEVEALRQGKPGPSSARPIADLKPGAMPEAYQNEDDANYARLFGPNAR